MQQNAIILDRSESIHNFRLYPVKDDAYTVERYEYDGLNRRIKSHRDTTGGPAQPCIDYAGGFV